MRWLIPLVLFLTGCLAPIHPSQIPEVGWTRDQVNLALQDSWQVSTSASGYEIRQYGISQGYGNVQKSCGRYTSTCLYVTLKDNVVIDVSAHER